MEAWLVNPNLLEADQNVLRSNDLVEIDQPIVCAPMIRTTRLLSEVQGDRVDEVSVKAA